MFWIGSVRRKPESRWRKKPEQLPGLVKTQAELLDAAVRSLRPGGYLLYSTCSPLVQETNAQIKAALDRHKDVALVNANEVLSRVSPSLKLNQPKDSSALDTRAWHRCDVHGDFEKQ